MRVSPSYSGLGETPAVTTAAKSATDTIIESIGKIIPLWQQQKIFNAQLQIEKARAQQTGSAIDTSNIQLPGIPLQVQTPPQTTYLIMGGIALLAVILLSQKRGR